MGMVRVNHTGYQHMVNLSPEFLARHPKLLKEAPDENPYNIPFRFAVPSPSVMIVGSGTGRSEEHTSELQSRGHLVCRLLLEKKKKNKSEVINVKYKLYSV